MPAPILRRLTEEQARNELHNLEKSLTIPIEDFEERARAYALTEEEASIWGRIEELRWLLQD